MSDEEIFENPKLHPSSNDTEEQARPAYDPEAFFKLADICPRDRCSRCSGQVPKEQWHHNEGRVLKTMAVDKAGRLCALYAKGIVQMQEFLANAKEPLIDSMRSLPVSTSVIILEKAFKDLGQERLPTALDEFGYHNVYADETNAKKGISYLVHNRDFLLRNRDALELRIAFAADASPASQIHEVAELIEPSWGAGLFELVGSRCFVDLTQVRFGKVIEATSAGLHTDGIYTFMKGHFLLEKLYWWLRTLCNFNNELREHMQAVEKKARQVIEGVSISAFPYMGIPDVYPELSPPKAHEHLQKAIETIAAARAVLENTIVGTMLSGEFLVLDHDAALTWKAHGTRNLNPDARKPHELHQITAGRLTSLMMMHALERDMKKYRITAARRAQGKGTKTALLHDWESLQNGLVAWLHCFGHDLLYATCFEGDNEPPSKDRPFRVWEIEDRKMIVSSQCLAWHLCQLHDARYTPTQRIQSLLAFLRIRKIAIDVFPPDKHFILEVLGGLQTVVEAMELFQPIGMGVFDRSPDSWPNYGGETILFAKYHHELSTTQIDDFTNCIWDKLELDQPGQIETKYCEVWNCVFEWLNKRWREHGVTENMLQKMAELRKKVKHLSRPKKPRPESDPAPSVSISLPPMNESAVVKPRSADTADREDEDTTTALNDLQPASARKGRASQQAKPKAAPLPSQQAPPGIPLFEFGSLQIPPKPSRFREELTWEEQQKRRGLSLLCSKKPPSATKNGPEDDDSAIPKIRPRLITFTDAKAYENWRCIFPLRSEGEKGGRLRWESLVSVLRGPPLDFEVADEGRNVLKFHRQEHDGWPVGVLTVHKPHGLNPWLEKHHLDMLRKDFRKAFDWEGENFVLVDDKEGGRDGSGGLDQEPDRV